MTIFDGIFPMGIGTNRFLIKGTDDEEGIEYSAQMMAEALNAGASYIDVAGTYSKGMAETVCRKAFEMTTARKDVTIKSSFLNDFTADDALRRAEKVLGNLGIDRAAYFTIWNIASYQQFQEIVKKGSLYDGARLAIERGYAEHICFSTHASPDDIMKMLNSGLFEGVTISFSVLNSHIMKPVLDCAEENQVGVIVMNPLGGGLIPQNKEYYSFLKMDEKESTVQAALRYVYAHPAVKVVLSGISTKEELHENLDAFRGTSMSNQEERIKKVDRELSAIDGFCTGCHYCDGCPKNINVFEMMQAYNTLLFPRPRKLYGKEDKTLLDNIGICSRLKNTFGYIPVDETNPCIGCGKCEKKCTAHLPIRARMTELYKRFGDSCFSQDAMQKRLKMLIGDKRKIGFYPGGGYTAYVLSLLEKVIPKSEMELYLFDSNSALWGTYTSGYEVFSPEKIESLGLDMVIVSNYNFADEIYQSLQYLQGKTEVVKLHNVNDVPWVF